MLHNKYLQRGGEDVSVETEAKALNEAGHSVTLFQLSNIDLSRKSTLAVAADAIWSRGMANLLGELTSGEKYDIVHVQNYFPQLSPSVHWAARRLKLPTVQHLRNFRFICSAATLYRDGAPCHDCVGAIAPWRGIIHACYRSSRPASAAAAAMVGIHKAVGTWKHAVGRYIAISDYVKQIHVEAGLPAEKISVRPNLVLQYPSTDEGRSEEVVAAGRFVPEKGFDVLIAGWRRRSRKMLLRIIGSGPDERRLLELAAGDPSISFEQPVAPTELLSIFARARAVVVPSVWAEPFGRVALEAMSVGTPVLASWTGGLPGVLGEESGLLFEPGNAADLDARLTWLTQNEQAWRHHATLAATRYRNEFSVAAIVHRTLQLYEQTIAEWQPRGAG
ncbi:MAG TPA: glycosyltransferase family 4 protein [Devosiaceae bacterium]|nr:glycosyltransferase family 4 protein [Devosiaceae bacterium]